MLLSEGDGRGERMTTAGVKCYAVASAHISGARYGCQLSVFCLYTSESGSFFLSGICIQKGGLFPHKNYSTSDAFSN